MRWKRLGALLARREQAKVTCAECGKTVIWDGRKWCCLSRKCPSRKEHREPKVKATI